MKKKRICSQPHCPILDKKIFFLSPKKKKKFGLGELTNSGHTRQDKARKNAQGNGHLLARQPGTEDRCLSGGSVPVGFTAGDATATESHSCHERLLAPWPARLTRQNPMPSADTKSAMMLKRIHYRSRSRSLEISLCCPDSFAVSKILE